MGMVKQYEPSVKDVSGLNFVTGKFSDGNPIDLGFPEHWAGTTADEENIEEAMAGLDELWMDCSLGTSGRRNRDAVNMCIYLHVLGCPDVVRWFEEMYDHHVILSYDHRLLMEHVERVNPYLCSWGPDYAMGRALDYVLN